MANSINLNPIGSYETGIFDEGAAEITVYDPASQRLFVVNGADTAIDALDISDPTNPTLEFAIAIEEFGAGVNSVAVKNGIVAAAVESDPAQDPGKVVFFDTEGKFLNQVTVGALPDLVTFSPDGNTVLVANEGEPNEDDPSIDPNGSVGIIDISGGVEAATVTEAGFTDFNGQEAELRSRGVRIFPDKSFAADAEPEYIAVSSDSSTAYVTLQENNAVAVVDIAAGEVTEIQPLGLKDHSRGLPELSSYPWALSGEVLGTTPTGQEILLGGLSGLFFEGETDDGKLQFITTPDRGPNGEPTDVNGDGENERPFPLPDYQARLIRFTLDRETGEIAIGDRIFLTRKDGTTPITGLPNLQAGEAGAAYTDEEPVDLLGNPLNNDPLGADMEGIVVAEDGSFWLSDEYRPAIYHFDKDGVLIDRLIPKGTAAATGKRKGTFGRETLPEVYAQRRSNRGFEGLALNTDNNRLYAFIQSPIDNPDVSDAEAEAAGESSDYNSSNSQVLRILEINPCNGKPIGEYVYYLEGSEGVDKIGDAVYAGDGKFYVIERDSGTDPDSKKFVFEVDLTNATNILKTKLSKATSADKALEGMTPDELEAMGINAVTKTKVLNLPSVGYLSGDKAEGLALLPNGSLAVINDNDFGLLDEEIPVDGSVPFNPDPVQTVLGIIDFDKSNGIDTSDTDGIDIRNQPVFGQYMPDGIATYEVDGETYYIIANEGDARDEDARVEDLELDPTAFPNATELQTDNEIGRLEVSTIDGDTDGDGDYDRLVSYGARSFSIFDSRGNLVFDSGDELEQITAEAFPDYFNSDNTENSFDTRSVAKGPEPEGVAIGVIDGKTYAFIGLERIGGVMIYDVSTPTSPEFVQYINNRDFEGDPEASTAGDLGPEGLEFISAEDSPNGKPLLAVGNEVSGSTTVYQINLETDTDNGGTDNGGDMDGNFTLQLLHAADQEAGVPAIEDAPNFSAVLNSLKGEYDNTLVLSSGDAYIPSPFFSASETAFDGQGRGDILIQNELGFGAIALGNHEFDLGAGTVADLISADEETDYPGTAFPYLSSNLDFSTDEDLAPLVTEDGQEASEIPNSIAGNTIVTVNGEPIGVVGATTPTLPSISSPGDVTVNPIEFDSANPDDIAALAAEIQASVDSLLAENPEINKVVLLAHMQQIAIEEQLSELLTDVDIIVAGGSNTILADETDRLRAGDEAEGVYPILNTAADGNPIAVVNTDGNYRYVGRLVADFDADGVLIPESIDPEVSGAYATDAEGVAAVNGTPDPEIVEVADEISAVIAEQDGNIFGSTEVFLNGEREDVRTQETNLGNLTADANLAIAKETDSDVVISIKNGGGIRDNIGATIIPPGSTNSDDVDRLPPQANELAGKEEGDISELDIANSLRFNNGLTLLTVTAEELLEVIEHGVAATEPGATPGQFPQVAGVEFSFDPELEPSDRVLSLEVVDDEGNNIDTVVENGELVGDASRTFRLVTLNFLADGGDDYPFPDRNRVDLALEEEAPRTGEATFAADGTEQDALAEYLADNFSEMSFDNQDTPPEEDDRIQNLNFRNDTVLGSDDTDGMGDMEFLLLDLTGSEDANVSITVSRDAFYDNTVGFFEVKAVDGTVIDPVSGKAIAPGDAGYLEAALANSLDISLSVPKNNQQAEFTSEVAGGKIYAPFLVVDGNVGELTDADNSNDPTVYFSYSAANSDNFAHVRSLGDNTYGFEDIVNGGDRNFNDLIVKVELA
ncbi:choice-of-anchor I family protein [Myxosarcina sp. GI1]|uniref:choice-of-anchor I family protein n=1 Tax=Myxosarcina sp. GI1 TaxID=1541065 RepID=UPI0009DF6EE0|nr:choice-of-anchor I family protein [Myxosarcina sp. GI1]